MEPGYLLVVVAGAKDCNKILTSSEATAGLEGLLMIQKYLSVSKPVLLKNKYLPHYKSKYFVL